MGIHLKNKKESMFFRAYRESVSEYIRYKEMQLYSEVTPSNVGGGGSIFNAIVVLTGIEKRISSIYEKLMREVNVKLVLHLLQESRNCVFVNPSIVESPIEKPPYEKIIKENQK